MGNGVSALLELGHSGRSRDDISALAEEIEALERIRALTLDRVRQLVVEAITAQDNLQALWRQIVARTAEVDVRELHSSRGLWFVMLDKVIADIRRLTDMIPKIDQLNPGAVPDAGRLPGVLRKLEQYRDLFAERWHDEDDLAAMIRSETRPLTANQLDAVAAKYQPPAEWYDEDVKPW